MAEKFDFEAALKAVNQDNRLLAKMVFWVRW